MRISDWSSDVCSSVLRIGDKRKAWNAEVAGAACCLAQQGYVEPLHPRQAANGFARAHSISDEQRPDEIRRGQHGFAVKIAAPCRSACAAQAKRRIGGVSHEVVLEHCKAERHAETSSGRRSARRPLALLAARC